MQLNTSECICISRIIKAAHENLKLISSMFYKSLQTGYAKSKSSSSPLAHYIASYLLYLEHVFQTLPCKVKSPNIVQRLSRNL